MSGRILPKSLPETCEIELAGGYIAIIDRSDFDLVTKTIFDGKLKYIHWFAKRNGHTVYAAASPQMDGGNLVHSHLLMHRVICGLTRHDPRKSVVDHIDRNGLNNRRSNLRVCTRQQNSTNRRIAKHGSQFIGVTWSKYARKWLSNITVSGKSKYLGYFESEIDAARARDVASLEYFGEFATLNFPNPDATTRESETREVC